MKKSVTKIDLKKIYNKIIWGNVALSLGFLLLIFSVTFSKTVFTDPDQVTGNIVACSLAIGLAIIFQIIFWSLYGTNGKKTCEKKWMIASLWTSFVPVAGIVIAFIWKTLDRKHENKKTSLSAKTQIPSTYTILFMVLIFVVIAIWILYIVNGKIGTEGKVPGIFDIFAAPIKGFAKSINLIVYLLVLGAFLHMMNESKTLECGMKALTQKMNGKEIFLIPIIMLLFSVGGTTFGMCEETLGFYAIVVPIMIAAGFDSFTAFLTLVFGAGLGVCGSTLNPFCIIAAADASNSLDPTNPIVNASDGIAWRATSYAIFVVLGIAYVTTYAFRVKKNQNRSIVYSLHEEHKKYFIFDGKKSTNFNFKRKLALWIFGLTYLIMCVCIIDWHSITKFNGFIEFHDWLSKIFPFVVGSLEPIGKWSSVEMAMLFFVSTVIIGLLFWKSEKNFLEKVFFGMKDFVSVAVVIAVASGISVIMGDSGVASLLADNLSNLIKTINPQLAIILMFFVFIIIAMAIPSTSGFARAVFPIVGPALSQTGTLSVSSGITAFSFASGFVNLSSPTAAVYVVGAQMAHIPLQKAYKGSLILLGALLIAMIVLLIGGTYLPSGIF